MRKLLLLTFVIITGLIFIGRLLYLQGFSSSDVALNDSAIKKEYIIPKRGYVYDRDGNLLVTNQPSYDLMVIPEDIKDVTDIMLNELCELLNISKETYDKELKKAIKQSRKQPYPIVKQLSKADYAILQEKLRKYNGFYIEKRSLRSYQTKIGANVLGSIGEVNNRDIKKNSYYKIRDLIGRTGVEDYYENTLRGVKGVKYTQKDKYNTDIGAYKDGIYDTLPVPGKDITLTIDSELQAYGELLMKHKRGGIIALDPKNGEILAMVSGPSYNPNLLVGRDRSKNFNKLYTDSIAKPMFDRGLKAMYPPGSPFKIINALIGLQEGVIDPTDKFVCKHGYYYGRNNRRMGCHSHRSPANLNLGIYESCNAYFANVYRKIVDKYDTPSEGLDNWSNHVKSFGLGNFLGNDLSVGEKGRVPNAATYNANYKNNWYTTFTLSNAIGQGEILATPIQLANMIAAVANRGFYYTPHIIKNIENDTIPSKFKTPNYTTIDKRHYDPVIEGLSDVYKKGTAKSLQVEGIEICGKTGTAENFTKIEGKATQLTDHSIFVAFAPKDDPKIAIAVFIENGYWGSRFAGRMSSLMIEKYLKDTISRVDLENWILTHSLENEYAKPYSGEPFKINGASALQVIDNYKPKLHAQNPIKG